MESLPQNEGAGGDHEGQVATFYTLSPNKEF